MTTPTDRQRVAAARRAALRAELAAAVDARAERQQLRQLRAGKPWATDPLPSRDGWVPLTTTTTRPRPLSERLDDRARRAVACLRELQAHARVFLTDPQDKRETLTVLRRALVIMRRATAAQHAVHDNPPHRAGDGQFRADCRRAMARYEVTATEAARIIVTEIARGMSTAAREDLLRESCWYEDERQQIRHLADRLQPRPPRKARPSD